VVTELNWIRPSANKDELRHILYEETAVKRLKKHKSPGIDDVTEEKIQAGGERVTEELYAICNQLWKEGSMSEDRTLSVIVTIPKKGDLSQCSNYRTIARLSRVGKVLVMMLLERLKAQVERYLSASWIQ